MFIFRTIFFFIHLGLILCLLATGLNAYWKPQWAAGLNLLSLAFPFLLIAYLLFCIYWVFDFRKRAIIFLIGLIFMMPMVQRWVNYSTQSQENETDLKVLSYNTKGISPEKQDFLSNEVDADILMLQESGWKDDKMKINDYQYTAHSEIVSIYSKYPIIKQEKITLIKSGYAQYADIKIKGKVIRFFNIYLNPFKFDKSMVKPTKNTTDNELKAKFLLTRLMETYKIHQNQLDEILHHIKSSPYPIILAGDFNAVPNSYEYYQINNELKDLFIESGNGSATSFHDYIIPIRIDYVFASEEIESASYSVDRRVKLSDHYPVYVDLKVR